MPLAGPLRAWIAKCKAYAAQHGCSYKDAMSALGGKGKKSHRRKSHRGGSHGGVADGAAVYTDGNTVEGAANMAGDPAKLSSPQVEQQQQHAAQTGGGMASAFEVGAMNGGRRRKRRGSKSKRRGSKRRGSNRRRSKRGGALSYSDF